MICNSLLTDYPRSSEVTTERNRRDFSAHAGRASSSATRFPCIAGVMGLACSTISMAKQVCTTRGLFQRQAQSSVTTTSKLSRYKLRSEAITKLHPWQRPLYQQRRRHMKAIWEVADVVGVQCSTTIGMLKRAHTSQVNFSFMFQRPIR